MVDRGKMGLEECGDGSDECRVVHRDDRLSEDHVERCRVPRQGRSRMDLCVEFSSREMCVREGSSSQHTQAYGQ